MNKVVKLPAHFAVAAPWGFLSTVPAHRLADLPCGALGAIVRTRDPEYRIECDRPRMAEDLRLAAAADEAGEFDPWDEDDGSKSAVERECRKIMIEETEFLRRMALGSPAVADVCRQLDLLQ